MRLLFEDGEVVPELEEVAVSEAEEAGEVAPCEVPDAQLHLLLVSLPAGHHVHIFQVSAIFEDLAFLKLPAGSEHIELIIQWVTVLA